MSDQELLKSKLIHHMIYNIIAFSIIFCIFGVFIFYMVKNITYISTDNELYNGKQRLTELNDLYHAADFIISTSNSKRVFFSSTETLNNNNILIRAVGSPRTIAILRNKNGEILNLESLGPFTEYANKIRFNEKSLEKIYEIEIDGKYSYRGINCVLEINKSYDEIQEIYIQLLVNVDSEKSIIDNYSEVITASVIIGIFLSIIASYILSKKTLMPIQETMKRQTEFVENASHEIRTPLTIIQAKQELLLQEPEAKIIDKSEEIALTLNETKRLTKLTKDLMILARADSKNMSLQKDNINIDEFIEELIKPYIDIAKMQEKEIVVNLEYKESILVDQNRIYQLMIILLDNAIKYTEEKDIIEINTFSKDSKCIIEIKDTGIGISEEGIKRVFERFYREDRVRNRDTGGSGLGLSIANIIVNSHGGSIKASHNNPKGTVFSIKLPIK